MSSETGTTGAAHDARSEQAKHDAEATKQKATAEAKEGGRVVAEEAKAVGRQAGELGREHAERRFEQGKERVEGQVDAMSDALDDAAQRLRAENNPLASYADELSGQLSQLSRGIENSTLDDIAVKTRRIARDNPGLFVLGSMVAGLAAARFFKASAEREHRERYGDDDYAYGDDRYGERSFEGRGDYRDRDEYRRSGGYGTTSARDDDYRSPVGGAAVPPRPDSGGVHASGGIATSPVTGDTGTRDTSGTGDDTGSRDTSGTGTAGATPSVSRVPMDSDGDTSIGTGTSTGATTPKTKTGA